MSHTSPAATGNPVPPVTFGEPVPTPRRSGSPPRPSAPAITVNDEAGDPLIPFDAPIFSTVDRETRTWTLPTLEYGFDTVDGPDVNSPFSHDLKTITFIGVMLGVSTTHRPTHICDYPSGYAPRSLRCGACRWFETRIFKLANADSESLRGMRYVLHYVGRSIVPGEVDLPRYELVRGGHEVVEAYTVRKEHAQPFITKPGAKVLAQAAHLDPEIEDAYVNRATA